MQSDALPPWFHIGAPDLTTLRAFRATGRQITAAELLLYVEADLQLRDGDTVLHDEPRLEVAELADALNRWAGDGTEPDHDFAFAPGGYDETDVVWVRRADDGWAAGSCRASGSTARRPWPAVRELIDAFVADTHERTAACLLAVGWSAVEAAQALRRGFDLPLAEAEAVVARQLGHEDRADPAADNFPPLPGMDGSGTVTA